MRFSCGRASPNRDNTDRGAAIEIDQYWPRGMRVFGSARLMKEKSVARGPGIRAAFVVDNPGCADEARNRR